jgi:hypothetical protein
MIKDKILSDKELDEIITKMSDGQREHLKHVISVLVQAYSSDDKSGVVLVGDMESNQFAILTVNATEYEVTHLLNFADEHVQYRIMATAPEKEMFN